MLKGNADHIIIDVRTPAEHRKSHLHGAVNYSYFSLKFGRMVEHLDRNELVFLYCETGHRSPLAARRMKRKGFRRVVDMKGGTPDGARRTGNADSVPACDPTDLHVHPAW